MISRRRFLMSSLFVSVVISSPAAMAGERISYSRGRLRRRAKGRAIDPGRDPRAVVPHVPRAGADPVAAGKRGEVQGSPRRACRLRQPEGRGASLRSARVQSTLITFKGVAETARSVGDTNAASIAALLTKPSGARAMTLATAGLAFLAGLLSVLSPCVLPLVPIVLGSAASEHRLGPGRPRRRRHRVLRGDRALRRDGRLFSRPGQRPVPDRQRRPDDLRLASCSPCPPCRRNWPSPAAPSATGRTPGSTRSARRAWPASSASACCSAPFGDHALAQRRAPPRCWPLRRLSLIQVTPTMVIFGVGAATPLALVGLLSRQVLMRWRGRLV